MPIADELEAEIRHIAYLGMTERESLPLLRALAANHNEKLFRVRAAFRLVRQNNDEEPTDAAAS